MLLGYILFNKTEYEAAAKALTRISVPELLGHNTNRYWAAAQFNQGLQLLGVDNKDKAFEAFARSLTHRGAAADNSKLAPLFIHFGLKSIEDRNGTRACHAFELLAETLDETSDSPTVLRDRLLAQLGGLLSHSLTDEDVEELGGDRFLELLRSWSSCPSRRSWPPPASAWWRGRFACWPSVRNSAARIRRDPTARRPEKQWYGFLTAQAAALENWPVTPTARIPCCWSWRAWPTWQRCC